MLNRNIVIDLSWAKAHSAADYEAIVADKSRRAVEWHSVQGVLRV